MAWLSDIFSGDDGPEGREAAEDPLERARQLREGVARAAAALEGRHPGLARSADEAAGELLERLPADGGESGREAVERLDRLHFALLQVDVTGRPPEEADAEEAVRAVRELAGDAPARTGPAGGAPDAGARGAEGSG